MLIEHSGLVWSVGIASDMQFPMWFRIKQIRIFNFDLYAIFSTSLQLSISMTTNSFAKHINTNDNVEKMLHSFSFES